MTQLAKRTVYYTALCVWPTVMLSRARDYLFLLFGVINGICVAQHVDHHHCRRLIILLLCGLVCDCRPTDRRCSSVPFFSSGQCVQYAHVIIIYVGIYVHNIIIRVGRRTRNCYRRPVRVTGRLFDRRVIILLLLYVRHVFACIMICGKTTTTTTIIVIIHFDVGVTTLLPYGHDNKI